MRWGWHLSPFSMMGMAPHIPQGESRIWLISRLVKRRGSSILFTCAANRVRLAWGLWLLLPTGERFHGGVVAPPMLQRVGS